MSKVLSRTEQKRRAFWEMAVKGRDFNHRLKASSGERTEQQHVHAIGHGPRKVCAEKFMTLNYEAYNAS